MLIGQPPAAVALAVQRLVLRCFRDNGWSSVPYRPVSGNGPGGWRWVVGERLASLGRQPGTEVSTWNAATGKGASSIG